MRDMTGYDIQMLVEKLYARINEFDALITDATDDTQKALLKARSSEVTKAFVAAACIRDGIDHDPYNK